ncbi:hypothetical protein J8J14_17640 [Roseomonas sp. SSH11]|uniref:Integrase catalytic domain-containing protein n=1 Tax=Pararoseomonas baculiformis TaxID=2820812 RepID=A0ABS4AHV1_9PROT|nr:hypothetical protein [Pararoseomonas baculiformis]MBP0446601.1 hypothetical protein [Pararoseomonas baculiformis]
MRPEDVARNRLLLFGEDRETARPMRVLRNRPSEDVLILFDCADRLAMPELFHVSQLPELPLRFAPKDSFYAPATHDDLIPEKYKTRRNTNWVSLQCLIGENEREREENERRLLHPVERGRMITLAVVRSRRAEPTMYRLLRLWWRGGMVENALLPRWDRCGGRDKFVPPADGRRPGRPAKGLRGLLAEPFDPEKLTNAADLYGRLIAQGTTPREAYFQVRLGVYCVKEEWSNVTGRPLDGTPDEEGGADVLPPSAPHIPSRAVLHYHAMKSTTRARIERSRTSRDRFDKDIRKRSGTAVTGARGPGQVYEIDATQWPVRLRSRRSTVDDIGLGTLYFVVDQYSQAYVGFHISLDAENSRGARMALAVACMDKVRFMRSIGIEIGPDDWPMHHVPTEIVTDGGPGFTAVDLRDAARPLGVLPTKTPSRKPFLKPFVENSFVRGEQSLLNRKVANHDGLGEVAPRHRLNGVLTLPELRRLVAYEILLLNRSTQVQRVPPDYTSADATKPTLDELWHFGVHGHGVPKVADHEKIERALYPRVTFAWTSNGLRLDGTDLLYHTDSDEVSMERLARRRAERWTGTVNPDAVEEAAIYLPDGTRLPLALAKGLEKRFPRWTYDEVQEERDRGAGNQPAKRDLLDHEASKIRARQDALVRQAEDEAGGVVATPSEASARLRAVDDPVRGAFRKSSRANPLKDDGAEPAEDVASPAPPAPSPYGHAGEHDALLNDLMGET